MAIREIKRLFKRAAALIAAIALILSLWQPVGLRVYAEDEGAAFEMDGNGEDWKNATQADCFSARRRFTSSNSTSGSKRFTVTALP